jgi:hypothetical protein
MDGWYVRQLLLNSDSIRSSIIKPYITNDILDDEYYNQEDINFNIDFDDDSYTDLLSIELMFKNLSDNGILTDKESLIIVLLSNGNSIAGISKKYNLNRNTISKEFNSACSKIAFVLGGYFTNDGFINHIEKTYKLSKEQENKLRKIMEN